MNYLDLPKPHGFLIWRGKQTAIASDRPLSTEQLLLVSDGQAFGTLSLSNPVAVDLKGFEELNEKHRIFPEERRLLWPDAKGFYVHWLKDFQPFEESKAIRLKGSEVEFLDEQPLTESQQALIEQARRLPKTLVLLDEAITLEDGKAVISNGLDTAKIEPILKAVFDKIPVEANPLSLYQLALVRNPNLMFGQKKSEDSMPYKTVDNHPGCKDGKPVGVVNKQSGKLEGCSENMDMAKKHMAALYAAENKKDFTGEKMSMMDEMPMSGMGDMPMMAMGGPTSFAELQAAEVAQEAAEEASELTEQFSMLAHNIMCAMDITDKPAALSALATEYAGLVQSAMEMKSLEGEKALGGYLVSGEEGDHLPTTEDGKLSHRLMGAAWAALHGGYRGNKYEGPGKAQAIAKLKKLYEKEDMPVPSEKGEDEVSEDAKVGKRMNGGMMAKLKAMYDMMTEMLGWASGPMEDEEMDMDKGFAIKQVNGKPWFIAYSTNAFKDREHEIFSTKSLEKYVEEAEQKGDRGYFNFWHIKTKEQPDLTDFAKKEWQGVVGRFLVEAGPFLENEKGQAALKFFSDNPDGHSDIAPEGWGCSPEYRYLPEERKSGIYDNIWITRTSVLPRLAAANIWTKGSVIMALSEQQKAAAVKIFGEDLAAKIIQPAEAATKELEEAGVDHKGESTTQETTEEKPNPELQAVLEMLGTLDFPGLSKTIEGLAEVQNQLKTELGDLRNQVKSLEKTEALKQKTEMPRFAWSMMNRAIESDKTVVTEDDPLKNMKPVETKPTQPNDVASQIFSQRR